MGQHRAEYGGKPPNGCKIKLLSLEVIFMAIKKDSPQKAAMREMTVELFTSVMV